MFVPITQALSYSDTRGDVFHCVLMALGVIQSVNCVCQTVSVPQLIPSKITRQVKIFVSKIVHFPIGSETIPPSHVSKPALELHLEKLIENVSASVKTVYLACPLGTENVRLFALWAGGENPMPISVSTTLTVIYLLCRM